METCGEVKSGAETLIFGRRSMTCRRSRPPYLALVLAGVPGLGPFNMQRPLVGVLVMGSLKPLI